MQALFSTVPAKGSFMLYGIPDEIAVDKTKVYKTFFGETGSVWDFIGPLFAQRFSKRVSEDSSSLSAMVRKFIEDVSATANAPEQLKMGDLRNLIKEEGEDVRHAVWILNDAQCFSPSEPLFMIVGAPSPSSPLQALVEVCSEEKEIK